jgi:hypothetical protein
MVFHHTERLKLSSDNDQSQIQFGDVLRCKDEKSGATSDRVRLVLTPACDLVRGGAESVLVLPGILTPLGAGDWSYGSTMTKTPIFTSADGSRFWIKWDLKGRKTVPFTALCELLHEGKDLEQLGRLREVYAIEIQQKLLADMGRIGQPANPPATFPVSITLYVVSQDATARALEVPELETSICFVGRDRNSKRVDHLVLSERACDALQSTIRDFSIDAVHTSAKASLTSMKTDLDFFDRFERGLIEVPLKDNALKPEKGSNDHIYMHVVRNNGVNEGEPVKGNHRNGPFIMKICDVAEPAES